MYDERTIVLTIIVASWDFCAFSTTAFRTDYHVAESRTRTLAIIRITGTTPLVFDAFLSGRNSLMTHDFVYVPLTDTV